MWKRNYLTQNVSHFMIFVWCEFHDYLLLYSATKKKSIQIHGDIELSQIEQLQEVRRLV